MCTLMQKDSLIHLVAEAQATLTLRIDPQAPFSDDELRLGEIHNFIYDSSPDDIDFNSLSEEIMSINSKYEDIPILEQYL